MVTKKQKFVAKKSRDVLLLQKLSSKRKGRKPKQSIAKNNKSWTLISLWSHSTCYRLRPSVRVDVDGGPAPLQPLRTFRSSCAACTK